MARVIIIKTPETVIVKFDVEGKHKKKSKQDGLASFKSTFVFSKENDSLDGRIYHKVIDIES